MNARAVCLAFTLAVASCAWEPPLFATPSPSHALEQPPVPATDTCLPTLVPTATHLSPPIHTPHVVPTTTLLDQDSGDSFPGVTLNTCKWDARTQDDASVAQDDELILTAGSGTRYARAEVYTQYRFGGDLDIQVEFRLDPTWSSHQPCDAWAETGLGVDAGDPNWVFIARVRNCGGDFVQVVTQAGPEGYRRLVSIPTHVTEGRLEIVRTQHALTFLLDRGQGWVPIYTLSPRQPALSGPASAYLFTHKMQDGRGVSTSFDNFRINSGRTDYQPLAWVDSYNRRDDFYVGATLEAYLGRRLWGQQWATSDPLQLMRNNGFEWARIQVGVARPPALENTPPDQWGSLYWIPEFNENHEIGEQMLVEAAQHGFRLDLVLYLSDYAAYSGYQPVPAEWAGITDEQLAQEVHDYAFTTVQQLRARGLHIELYEIGNEIEWGILGYTPRDKVPVPPGVNEWTNLDFRRNEIWEREAMFLRSAIEGVREADPGGQIVLHVDGLDFPSNIAVRAFFQTMVDESVPFDYAGLSLPYASSGWTLWRYSSVCWFQRMQGLISFLASLGKKVVIDEAAYPSSVLGSDAGGSPMPDYPFTAEGQAAWVHDNLAFFSNNTNVVAYFYWGGENYALPDSNWTDYLGLFHDDGLISPAMEEFRVNLP